jgi:hypothetical protein
MLKQIALRDFARRRKRFRVEEIALDLVGCCPLINRADQVVSQ